MSNKAGDPAGVLSGVIVVIDGTGRERSPTPDRPTMWVPVVASVTVKVPARAPCVVGAKVRLTEQTA